MTVSIAPSILAADFLHLEKEIGEVEAAGADLIHVDVMDGHFVPNLTIGPPVVKALRPTTALPFDVHLMIENPDSFLDAFAEAGADLITIHVETGYHLFRTVDHIKSLGKRAGVALNPATPLISVEDLLPAIDLLLVMTVNPGFGGQSYIPSMTEKIRAARRMIDASGYAVDLQADGGIKAENAGAVVEAGARILVMGTEIFGSIDYAAKIADVRKRTEGLGLSV